MAQLSQAIASRYVASSPLVVDYNLQALSASSGLSVDNSEPLTATVLPEAKLAGKPLVDESELPEVIVGVLAVRDEHEASAEDESILASQPDFGSSLVDVNEPLAATSLLVNHREPQIEAEASSLLVEQSEPSATNASSPLAPEGEPPEQRTPEVEKAIAPDRPTPLLQRQLAERLKVNEATLWRKRQNEDFADWTRNHDPDGVAWEYRPAKKGMPQYYPREIALVRGGSAPSWDTKVESFCLEVSRHD